MTTSRQRRKQKSGSSSSSRSKRAAQKRIHRAPSVQGPAALRENWDKNATVRQNYRRLGLLGDLSMRDSGGGEKEHGGTRFSAQRAERKSDDVGGARTGMAIVRRDESGAIVEVQETDEGRQVTAWGEAFRSDSDREEHGQEGDDDDEVEEEEERKTEDDVANRVVQVLEEAARTAKPVHRFTSDHEFAWLQQMVNKHGNDVSAMSRDQKNNVWQKTAGEIRRAIDKAGGLASFMAPSD